MGLTCCTALIISELDYFRLVDFFCAKFSVPPYYPSDLDLYKVDVGLLLLLMLMREYISMQRLPKSGSSEVRLGISCKLNFLIVLSKSMKLKYSLS